jgi:hypothetical protein
MEAYNLSNITLDTPLLDIFTDEELYDSVTHIISKERNISSLIMMELVHDAVIPFYYGGIQEKTISGFVMFLRGFHNNKAC